MVAIPDSAYLDPAFPVARVEAAVRADFAAHQRTEYLGIGYDPEPRPRSDPHVGMADAEQRGSRKTGS